MRGYDRHPFLSSNALRDGKPLETGIPADVRLYICKGAVNDHMANPLSYPIVSDRFLDLVRQFSTDFQVFDAPFYDKDSGEAVGGYKVMHVTRLLQAVDIEKSKTRYLDLAGHRVLHVFLDGFVFKGDLIPADVHVFKPAESLSSIVVSDELAQAMVGKVQGVALMRTKTV
jgi:hypothetical protein